MTPRNTRRHETRENPFVLNMFRVFRVFVIFVLCLSANVRSAFAQQTHIVVVTGVPGDQEHAQKFDKWAKTFIDEAKTKDAVPDANITYLSDKQATKVNLEKALNDVAARAKSNDSVVLLLIGHGSFDGSTAAFNLMGPDLTAADYARLLSQEATRLSQSIDKLLTYARYSDAQKRARLELSPHDASELIEQGVESLRPALAAAGFTVTLGDGKLASAVFLGTGRAESALKVDTSDPAVRALVDERDAIQKEIEGLQLRKASMDPAQYDAQMEKLLTSLALKTKALRDLQAKKDGKP